MYDAIPYFSYNSVGRAGPTLTHVEGVCTTHYATFEMRWKEGVTLVEAGRR